MRRSISAWLGIVTASTVAAAPRSPTVQPIEDVVASIPAEKGEFETTQQFTERLLAMTKPLHRVLYPAEKVYNADTGYFRISIKDLMAKEVHRKGEGIGTTAMNVRFPYVMQDVSTFSLEPANAELFQDLYVPCDLALAPFLKNDLQVLVDFRISPPRLSKSPLVATRKHHTASLDDPWDGVLRDHILHVDVVEVAVVRRSSGEKLYSRTAAQLQAERERVEREKAERERAEREKAERERAERERQWPVTAQRVFEEGCKSTLQGSGDLFERICRCLREGAERKFPKNAPSTVPSGSELRDMQMASEPCLDTVVAPPGEPPLFKFFKPSREPAHPWSTGRLQLGLSRCRRATKERVKDQWSDTEVRYQCECVGWRLQDQYSSADFSRLPETVQQEALSQASTNCDEGRRRDLAATPR